ncbi:MAG: glycosyltransferase family 4 protein [Anaerolineales bacterium]|nr:glycosyltransferase family 4 protein [Anaerolineales bacterium]
MDSTPSRFRIAYAIQNIGGIDFSQDIGDTVPVKQSLLGLQRAGHTVHCFRLRKRDIIRYDNVAKPDEMQTVPVGFSGTGPFKLVESGIRRLQKTLNLPYYAFFDAYRFYEASLRFLPEHDLCHEHNGLFCIGAALACKRLGKPYVLTFSADLFLERAFVGHPLKGLHAKIAAWQSRYTYDLAKKILCVSEAAKNHLIKAWQVDPEKIVVMPNGVDIDLFQPGPPDQALHTSLGLQGQQVISFVGGFQPWHGLEILVESFAMCLQEVPNIKLLLVGDGRAREDVEKAIRKFGVSEHVIITGFVPQQQVPNYLSLADMAVMPYPELPKELWFSPLKMYEYMSAGKAIVASRAGQIAEVIQHGENGVLVEPGDKDDLARTMIRLLKNPEERHRLGATARQQAVAHHSWDQYIRKLENIYSDALNPVQPRSASVTKR